FQEVLSRPANLLVGDERLCCAVGRELREHATRHQRCQSRNDVGFETHSAFCVSAIQRASAACSAETRLASNAGRRNGRAPTNFGSIFTFDVYHLPSEPM